MNSITALMDIASLGREYNARFGAVHAMNQQRIGNSSVIGYCFQSPHSDEIRDLMFSAI